MKESVQTKSADPNHTHDIKKTHVLFVEYDDVNFSKLVKDTKYFGEGNSKERVLEYDFEYCLGCGLRLLDGKPVITETSWKMNWKNWCGKQKTANTSA